MNKEIHWDIFGEDVNGFFQRRSEKLEDVYKIVKSIKDSGGRVDQIVKTTTEAINIL